MVPAGHLYRNSQKHGQVIPGWYGLCLNIFVSYFPGVQVFCFLEVAIDVSKNRLAKGLSENGETMGDPYKIDSHILVGGLNNCLFSTIYGIILPID
jgi:hypothetical protein